MDTTFIIEIIIAVVVAYLIIKFIISPIIKAIAGVVFFLVAIYLLQRYLGFNLDQILAPFGISLNKLNLNFILGPVNSLIDQIKHLLNK